MTLRREAIEALIAAIEPLDGLIAGQYAAGEGQCCALGALGLRDSTVDVMGRRNRYWLKAEALGLARYDIIEGWDINDAGSQVANANDDEEHCYETPAERKVRMLAWLRGQL